MENIFSSAKWEKSILLITSSPATLLATQRLLKKFNVQLRNCDLKTSYEILNLIEHSKRQNQNSGLSTPNFIFVDLLHDNDPLDTIKEYDTTAQGQEAYEFICLVPDRLTFQMLEMAGHKCVLIDAHCLMFPEDFEAFERKYITAFKREVVFPYDKPQHTPQNITSPIFINRKLKRLTYSSNEIYLDLIETKIMYYIVNQTFEDVYSLTQLTSLLLLHESPASPTQVIAELNKKLKSAGLFVSVFSEDSRDDLLCVRAITHGNVSDLKRFKPVSLTTQI